VLGSAIIAALLFLIIRGISELPAIKGIILIIGGIVMLFLFILHQSRIISPVMNLSLFRNRCFSFSNAAILIYTTSTLAVVFLFSFYLQYIKGYDSRSAGLILLISTLIMASLVIYAGRLSDRMNLYNLALIGTIISLTGLLPMAFISPITSLSLAVVEMVLISAGGAFFYPPLVKIILGSIPRGSYGVGSSLAETMRLIGNSSSLAMVTIGFNLYLGGKDITPDNYTKFLQSMNLILVAFSILCVASLILVLLAERTKHKK
jgi:low affinity Fe/Cu permease